MPNKKKAASLRLARKLRKKFISWVGGRENPSDVTLGKRFVEELDQIIQRLATKAGLSVDDTDLLRRLGKLLEMGRFLFSD